MIPLAPLAPIQRIGYLSGHIVCKQAIDPFAEGGLYPASTRVRPARSSVRWEDALGRSTELELCSQETIAVVGGIEHGFAPAGVRVNSELPILGDYQALLDHFDIPELGYLGDIRTGQMQNCLERVCQLEELIGERQPGFAYLPHQWEDLARAMLTDGAILAWMTGLGKALGLLSWPLLKLGWIAEDFLYPREPALILCPDELVEQLEAEAKRFFGLHPMILTRFDVTEPGLYLAGYHKLARNLGTLRNPGAFAAVAMDEATKIKSAGSQIGRAARTLAPRYRMVASATPIKNRIVDFFWLLWWVSGGKDRGHAGFPYGQRGERSFTKMYLTTADNRTLASQAAKRTGYYRSYHRPTAQVCNLPGLWRLAAPYLLRRRKDEVAGIVPKHDHRIVVPMGEEQARVYAALLARRWLDCNGLPATFGKLQALRMAAVAPHAKTLQIRTRSSATPKLSEILRIVREVVGSGDPIVVFSAFHAATDMIVAELPQARTLDGRNAPAERARVAAEFAAGGFQILAAGDNSMGLGFNFAHCRHVIRTSPEWPLDISEQPPDRCHRLTSKRDVHVYSLIAAGTIEAAVDRLLGEKRVSSRLALDALGAEPAPEAGEILAAAHAEMK